MKKITTWSPDTCGCTINYVWDDNDPPETRIHTYVTPQRAAQTRPDLLNMDGVGMVTIRHSGNVLGESICQAHTGHKSRGMDMFKVISEETSRKESAKQTLKGFFTPAMISQYVTDHSDVLDQMAATVQLPKALGRRLVKDTLTTATDQEVQDLVGPLIERSCTWAYDDGRVLHLKLPFLEDAHKKSVQSKLDQAHGPGRVLME